MKPDYFTASGLYIERRRNREGPVVTYTIWKPNTSRIFTDTKAALKFIAWPASTPTGEAIREWFKSFEPKDQGATLLPRPVKRIAAEGFGPENHEPEPDDNTKMVT
tara:strand:- start:85 stop:402 length:318 start_codon:yes stop_codon:yes gene_type:complete